MINEKDLNRQMNENRAESGDDLKDKNGIKMGRRGARKGDGEMLKENIKNEYGYCADVNDLNEGKVDMIKQRDALFIKDVNFEKLTYRKDIFKGDIDKNIIYSHNEEFEEEEYINNNNINTDNEIVKLNGNIDFTLCCDNNKHLTIKESFEQNVGLQQTKESIINLKNELYSFQKEQINDEKEFKLQNYELNKVEEQKTSENYTTPKKNQFLINTEIEVSEINTNLNIAYSSEDLKARRDKFLKLYNSPTPSLITPISKKIRDKQMLRAILCRKEKLEENKQIEEKDK